MELINNGALAPPLKPSEVLWEGVRTVQKYGWCQGSIGSKSHGYCILGSLGNNYTYNWAVAVNSLKEYLKTNSLAQWNDEFMRTKAQVINALQRTADLLSSQGK